MEKDETVEGTVTALPGGGLLSVQLQDGREILAHLAGKMRYNHIRVVIGDRVLVLLDPQGGSTTNRVVRRV